MRNQYYLLIVKVNKKPLKNPVLISLHPMPLEDKKRKISWMKIGQGANDDYRVCKRISRLEFECDDTKEIFNISEERGNWTNEAYSKFLNEF